MKKIIAFGASNSPKSINKSLAVFAANQLENVEVQVLDLNDFELPVYGIKLEESHGVPQAALDFLARIKNGDALVISLAEYNGLFSTAFKNLWDWMSRAGDMKIWKDKPIFLLATSPGARPEKNVMQVSLNLFPIFGGQVVSHFTLPSFYQNFQENKIVVPELKEQFQKQINQFQQFINNN